MSIAWILCLALLLIVPVNMIYAGHIRQNSCNKSGAKFGYASKLALSSENAWYYAQKLCPKRYMIAGVILAVITLAMMLIALELSGVSVCVYAITLLMYELLVWGFVVISVESGLRKFLGIKEE